LSATVRLRACRPDGRLFLCAKGLLMTPFTLRRRVEFRDTDAAGIVHFSVYFNYMEEAEHALLRSLGTSVVTSDAEGPISWPRVAAACEFRGALRFEDE